MFGSGLFKDFRGKLLTYINETERVKDDIAQDILPGMLNKFDEYCIATKAVHSTLSNHQKSTSIEYIEKTVKIPVDNVV